MAAGAVDGVRTFPSRAIFMGGLPLLPLQFCNWKLE
jgi:hypothetical protein